jgi:hypothetical protein
MENEENESFFPNLEAGEKITKRGLGARPILESQIKAAQAASRSAFEAARTLGISYNTYKKWAKLYGIFEDLKNPKGIGINKGGGIRNRKYNLDDLLDGKYIDYPLWKYKKKIFDSGQIPEACSCCGFEEKRISDNKSPILIDFIDGDPTNRKIDNIRSLCYNCYFLLVGDVRLKIIRKNIN